MCRYTEMCHANTVTKQQGKIRHTARENNQKWKTHSRIFPWVSFNVYNLWGGGARCLTTDENVLIALNRETFQPYDFVRMFLYSDNISKSLLRMYFVLLSELLSFAPSTLNKKWQIRNKWCCLHDLIDW